MSIMGLFVVVCTAIVTAQKVSDEGHVFIVDANPGLQQLTPIHVPQTPKLASAMSKQGVLGQSRDMSAGQGNFHAVTASVYWIGEGASADNDYISNIPSAWSSDAVADFGGVDRQTGQRNFTPRHNTFYFALPAAEFNSSGPISGAREKSPWAHERVGTNQSLFKGRWIEVKRGDRTLYAQWHDVGPNAEDDYDYVFGNARPKNTFGLAAGLDLSPDAANYLSLGGGAEASWRFVSAGLVPHGPWKDHPSIDNITRW